MYLSARSSVQCLSCGSPWNLHCLEVYILKYTTVDILQVVPESHFMSWGNQAVHLQVEWF